MKRKRNVPKRSYPVSTSLTKEEYDRVTAHLKNTTCRSVAEFLRDRINRQPDTIFYRNQSADEFLPIALSLKNELVAVGKVLRQAIVQLQLSSGLPAIKTAIDELETRVFSLDLKIEEIKMRLNQIYEQWLQK